MAAASVQAPITLHAHALADVPVAFGYEEIAQPWKTGIEDAHSYESLDLFPAKMLEVLSDMGFDDAARDKVYERICSNMVSTTGSTESAEEGKELTHIVSAKNVRNTVEDLITGEGGLLDKKMLRKKNLVLNSNEPVLMLTLGKVHYRAIHDMQLVRDAAVQILRENGIRPVRVFVRGGETLTLTLLNVVNTDIGSPSMVNLLDVAFYQEEWKNDLISKEAWNGTDLLWRDEDGWHQSSRPKLWNRSRSSEEIHLRSVSPPAKVHTEPQGDAKLSSSKSPSPSPKSESFTELDETPHTQIVEEASNPDEKETVGMHDDSEGLSDDDGNAASALERSKDESSEHPAMKALLESEAKRPGIQYPSWNRRENSTSLIDLIQNQSATVLKQDETLTDIDDHESSKESSGMTSDDGFVFVQNR